MILHGGVGHGRALHWWVLQRIVLRSMACGGRGRCGHVETMVAVRR